MATYYDDWLAASRQNEQEVHNTPVVARGKNLDWIETPHDYKIAMIIGRHVGFPTQGGQLMKAEIPVGCHTGKRKNGDEAIHILEGSGFIVVDGARYNFKPGTTINVPFLAERQMFNTGQAPVVYVYAMTMDLDLFVKLGRLEQLEEKGKNPSNLEELFPPEKSQFNEEGRRIALHLEDAPDENKRREAGHQGHKVGQQAHRHGAILILMGGSESPSDETNGFQAKAVAMSNIFEEVAMTSSHKHSHTEAMLYVLEGKGYSEIDGKRYDWSQGDAVHVPPKMTVHEHFNNSESRTRTLRIEFGIRYFYEEVHGGFHKVEHRLHAQKLQHEAAPTPTAHHAH